MGHPRPFGKRPASKKKEESYTTNFAKSRRRTNKENIPPPAPRATTSVPPKQVTNAEVEEWKKKAANSRRSYLRAAARVKGLKKEKKDMKEKMEKTLKHQQTVIVDLKAANISLQARMESLHQHIAAASEDKVRYQASIRALNKRIIRFGASAHCTSTRSSKKSLRNRASLTQKGHATTYNAQTRDLARHLHKSGCAPSKIGPLIIRIAASFGVNITRAMSRRTVQRCVLEALAAADMQLGHELRLNEGITISQDSTSNRSINYQSHHVTVRVPNYAIGESTPNPNSTPVTRLVRVASTVDHSAKTSANKWLQLLEAVFDVYSDSPLAKRSNASFSLRQFALKLKGMISDHANGEQASFTILKDWKTKETEMELGEQRMLEKDLVELLAFLNERKAKMIDGLGGLERWKGLTEVEQSVHEEQLMDGLKRELGKEEYESLPEEARFALDLFVWAGCCMHKDQNSFKGGAAAMGAFWEEKNLDPPILLANKANAAKVREALNPSRKDSPLTPEEEAAIAASTRGGVKATALAGALMNNKDDKKGFGDQHTIHLAATFGVKETHRFPDTSNTRFNSHAEAAAELLKHLEFYKAFLDDSRLRKLRPGWTNIELNLFNALKDKPTLTELAVMVLYSQAVTHPYLRVVRGSGNAQVNLLDLGSFHKDVREFCEKLVNDPDLLVDKDATYQAATLDGKPWEDEKAITAIRKLQAEDNLPYLASATAAFFQGALTTWVRFSSEFAPGGTIDGLTLTERDLAWMPATNDVNEGALGAYRVRMRAKPTTTLLNYNAHAVCEKNNTLAFMAAMFTEEDYTYVRKVARRWDASGMERKRREEQAAFEKRLAEMKREKEALAKQQAKERQERLSAVVFVGLADIDGLRVRDLDEQLDAWQLRGGVDDVIPKYKSHRGLLQDKRDLLRKVLLHVAEKGDTHPPQEDVSMGESVEAWTQDGDEMEIEMEVEGDAV